MKRHILIIDDEEDIRSLLQATFERQDYRVTAVANKQEALKVARADAPALIISDLQLADEDGLVVLAELKQVLPLVPSILLTGMLFTPKAIETIEKTVSAYLPKTTRVAKIIQVARTLLGAGEPVAP